MDLLLRLLLRDMYFQEKKRKKKNVGFIPRRDLGEEVLRVITVIIIIAEFGGRIGSNMKGWSQ